MKWTSTTQIALIIAKNKSKQNICKHHHLHNASSQKDSPKPQIFPAQTPLRICDSALPITQEAKHSTKKLHNEKFKYVLINLSTTLLIKVISSC